MKKKYIIITIVVYALLVFLSLGEHENNSLNNGLAKIGLKISIEERVQKDDAQRTSSGLGSMFDYNIVTSYKPNYVGLIGYMGILGLLIYTTTKGKDFSNK